MKRPGLQILGPVVLSAALVVVPASLPAQTGSLFGGRGPTAQPNLNGARSGVGGLGGNIGGIGSTGFGLGTGIGTTGFSPLGTTGMGAPMTGIGAPTIGMQSGTGTGFVGRNFTAPGFVGVRQAGQTTQGFGRTGMAGGFGAGGFNQFGGQLGGGQFGGFGQNQFGGNRSQRGNDRNQQFGSQNQSTQFNQQPQIVVRSEIAFPYAEQPPVAVATRLEGQLQRIAARRPEFGNLAFQLQPNGDVTLRGTVPDESSRRLAAALVRLEPGVRSVKNELAVAPPR